MKSMCGPPLDVISDLPDNVVEKILVLLPTRDAVRTTVLSKKWRFNWINIPVLAFDDISLVDPYPSFFCKRLPPDQLSVKNRLFATIYHILLLHRGPILKFSLSISELKSCSEIDALITILSNRGVKELTLQIWMGDPQELPQSLFSCQQLTYLNLRSCVFKWPTTVKGFPRVVCLELRDVIITADLFETFVSSCPVLEQLRFESTTIFDFIGISAPNLKVLSLIGIIKSICVKNAPKVENLSIHSKASVGGVVERGGKFGWASLLRGLPVLKSLHTDGHYFTIIVANLNRTTYLREVEMRHVSGTNIELHFMKLLLSKSQGLESMVVRPNPAKVSDGGLSILKKLTEFQRLSPRAKIIYRDPNE